jgi:Uma2 family endonuclease
MTTLTKRITVAEFRDMDFSDDNLAQYELINGELVRRPSPAPKHQIISGNQFREIDKIVREKNLGIIYAPVDVSFDNYNLVQPDVLFITTARRDIITNDGVVGTPDLAVEIISPSSVVRDRVDKLKLYERFGVKEYWLIDAQNASAETYLNTPNGYEIFSEFSPLPHSTEKSHRAC